MSPLHCFNDVISTVQYYARVRLTMPMREQFTSRHCPPFIWRNWEKKRCTT